MNPSSLRILLTGTGSGLGRGLALALAGNGHHLLLTDKNGESANETRSLLGPAADRASAHALDVTSSAQIDALLASLGDQRIDVLINNAGLQHVSPIEDFPEEKWDLLMDVMLKGPFLLTKAVLPRMRRQGFGRVINIGSIHSLVASPFKAAYVAAKHGLLGFTKTAALETADAEITVNTICPAYLRTPLVEAQLHAQAQARGITEQQVIDQIMLEPMPKKRFITTEEVAAMVEFLMSPEARNITGQSLPIDGGWVAR
ncbi:MAG TPA: 3-hydroxybutyrate dehydrogenase [Tepidisphaeraceae bacterium]|jgi:3-hydroxybutyrate dehydrogenase|nr:3-hydroxybutyrate dehydrogenase [Tepidisphaeraceae bacterium]